MGLQDIDATFSQPEAGALIVEGPPTFLVDIGPVLSLRQPMLPHL